jgi:DNA mismatch repair protein MutH
LQGAENVAFELFDGFTAMFCVAKPDRSEHGVQWSKAKSREKLSYVTQVLLSKKKESFF